jgi:predicted membrane-bound mannosyltransferase
VRTFALIGLLGCTAALVASELASPWGFVGVVVPMGALAGVIATFVKRGRSNLLAQLQGKVSPEDLFVQVPGIGGKLAHRIATELDIETLEELEQTAHDSRLRKVEGIGSKRAETVRVGLAGLLSGAARPRIQRGASTEEAERDQPSVETLLELVLTFEHRVVDGADAARFMSIVIEILEDPDKLLVRV